MLPGEHYGALADYREVWRRKAVLIIVKLDRLARNVAFIANLMETGIPFVAADRPNASPFELHIYAAMAEEEARQISERTKAALAAAKARSVKLGKFPADRAVLTHPGAFSRQVLTREAG